MVLAQTIADLMPHAQLGHYTILEHVADGGMGHVYKAFEPALQREVAIKVLKPDLASNNAQVAHFEEEAQNIAALRHPNIVPIYYIGTQGTLVYFVMAFIPGGATLDEWIEAGSPLNPEQALWVMYQAADALDCALKHKIVHLDIKPSNFLVDGAGSILLTDFGLARTLGSENQSSECYGTPAYMSPEQILNQSTDQRSDIYALGATMYHLMTSHLLYDADNMDNILTAHVQAPFPYKEAESYALSSGWINLFDRMTQKNPDDRFQTYDELRTALNQVDRLTPVRVRMQEEKAATIPVPNRTTTSRSFLYGLLKPSCAPWVENKLDTSVRKTGEETLKSIEKPLKPLNVQKFTEVLLEIQKDVSPDLKDLVDATALMPNVGAFLISLANTPFRQHGDEREQDISVAIQNIGLELAHHIILTGLILKENFPQNPHFDWMPLIQHSMSTGLTTVFLLELIDHQSKPGTLSRWLPHPGKAKAHRLAYFAGLIHDIGKIVLGEVSPYSTYVAMRSAMDKQVSLHTQEKYFLGIEHQEVGEMWCAKFTLDSAVREVVTHHNELTGLSHLAAATTIANQLVKRHGLGFSGSPIVEAREVTDTHAWKEFIKELPKKTLTPEAFEQNFARHISTLPILSL